MELAVLCVYDTVYEGSYNTYNRIGWTFQAHCGLKRAEEPPPLVSCILAIFPLTSHLFD